MDAIARRAFLLSASGVAVVTAALACWRLRTLLALVFLAVILAAAMRPGVEALRRRRVPGPVGVALHYLVLFGLVALLLWLIVPKALHQLEAAVPTSQSELARKARSTNGLEHRFLVAIQTWLAHLPPPSHLVHPALALTTRALEIVGAVTFVFASAAYWVFDRDRAQELVGTLLPARRRRVVVETWNRIDEKLGAYVRGVFVMVVFVSVVLSFAFWQIGVPYWLLLGVFAGVVELMPVIGPLAAGLAAVGVALTVSWQTAALAAAAVYGLRLLQDYVLGPRVLGHAVGLAPIVILVAVTAVGLLLGPAVVPLATPFTATLVAVLEVFVVRGGNERDRSG